MRRPERKTDTQPPPANLPLSLLMVLIGCNIIHQIAIFQSFRVAISLGAVCAPGGSRRIAAAIRAVPCLGGPQSAQGRHRQRAARTQFKMKALVDRSPEQILASGHRSGQPASGCTCQGKGECPAFCLRPIAFGWPDSCQDINSSVSAVLRRGYRIDSEEEVARTPAGRVGTRADACLSRGACGNAGQALPRALQAWRIS